MSSVDDDEAFARRLQQEEQTAQSGQIIARSALHGIEQDTDIEADAQIARALHAQELRQSRQVHTSTHGGHNASMGSMGGFEVADNPHHAQDDRRCCSADHLLTYFTVALLLCEFGTLLALAPGDDGGTLRLKIQILGTVAILLGAAALRFPQLAICSGGSLAHNAARAGICGLRVPSGYKLARATVCLLTGVQATAFALALKKKDQMCLPSLGTRSHCDATTDTLFLVFSGLTTFAILLDMLCIEPLTREALQLRLVARAAREAGALQRAGIAMQVSPRHTGAAMRVAQVRERVLDKCSRAGRARSSSGYGRVEGEAPGQQPADVPPIPPGPADYEAEGSETALAVRGRRTKLASQGARQQPQSQPQQQEADTDRHHHHQQQQQRQRQQQQERHAAADLSVDFDDI